MSKVTTWLPILRRQLVRFNLVTTKNCWRHWDHVICMDFIWRIIGWMSAASVKEWLDKDDTCQCKEGTWRQVNHTGSHYLSANTYSNFDCSQESRPYLQRFHFHSQFWLSLPYLTTKNIQKWPKSFFPNLIHV